MLSVWARMESARALAVSTPPAGARWCRTRPGQDPQHRNQGRVREEPYPHRVGRKALPGRLQRRWQGHVVLLKRVSRKGIGERPELPDAVPARRDPHRVERLPGLEPAIVVLVQHPVHQILAPGERAQHERARRNRPGRDRRDCREGGALRPAPAAGAAGCPSRPPGRGGWWSAGVRRWRRSAPGPPRCDFPEDRPRRGPPPGRPCWAPALAGLHRDAAPLPGDGRRLGVGGEDDQPFQVAGAQTEVGIASSATTSSN